MRDPPGCSTLQAPPKAVHKSTKAAVLGAPDAQERLAKLVGFKPREYSSIYNRDLDMCSMRMLYIRTRHKNTNN